MMTKIVHVQSVLLYEDTIALKAKTGESSIKEAISKAIYHYLNCRTSDRGVYHINPNNPNLDSAPFILRVPTSFFFSTSYQIMG